MNARAWKIGAGTLVICLSCSSVSLLQTTQQAKRESTPGQGQKTFATPKEAAEALIKATASFDLPELKEILGPDEESLVSSEDPVQDKNRAAAFAEKAG